MITSEQEAALTRIDRQLAQLEQRRSGIQRRIHSLPEPAALTEVLTHIELPSTAVLAEQFSEYLLSPLITPLQQLQDASEVLKALPDTIEDRLSELADDIEQLADTPETLQEALAESQEKVEDALDHLKDVITADLIPQWDELRELFQEVGQTSLDEFKVALQATLNNLDETIVKTVHEAVERKFQAVTQVRGKTESLVDNTVNLAAQIEAICNTLAENMQSLSVETSRANLGVDKTIAAITEIEDSLRRTLPI